jgi:hypothetical protein
LTFGLGGLTMSRSKGGSIMVGHVDRIEFLG